ncbi:MAG TPA: hypothetical protein ENI59_00130 [Euryarchaeota archaeon]|nr:hypothetical protein [Euryarchaeota archaeon]
MTQDFTVYYKIAKFLSDRNISYIHLQPEDLVPPDVTVIITTKEESDKIEHPNKIVITRENDINEFLENILVFMRSGGNIEHIIIGVDPGEDPGLVVLNNGIVISAKHLKKPEEVGKEVKRILRKYSPKSCIIRVGSLSGIYMYRVLKSLKGVDARIEIVDETTTSLRLRRNSDILAAIRIAMRSGREIDIDTLEEIDVPKGLIRDIQRRSRILSKGKITISRDLAIEVALGKISLEKAIEKMYERKRHNKLSIKE